MLHQKTLKDAFTHDLQALLKKMPCFGVADLFLPGVKKIPDEFIDPLKKKHYFEVEQVPLSLLASAEFLGGFVHNGRLMFYSRDISEEFDCSASMYPDGILHLNLTEDFYQTVRLQGKKSKRKYLQPRYLVDLNLEKLYRAGGDNFINVVNDLAMLTMNLVITWEPPDSDVLSSSIMEFFVGQGLTCIEKKNKLYKHAYKDVAVPISGGYTKPEGDTYFHSFREVYEWLGAIAINSNISEESHGVHVSAFRRPPLGFVPKPFCRRLSIRGVITDLQIKALVRGIANLMHGKAKEFADSPWFALTLCSDFSLLEGSSRSVTWIVFPDNSAWAMHLADD